MDVRGVRGADDAGVRGKERRLTTMAQRRSHWYTTSCRVITQAIEDARAQGLDGKALVNFVSYRYPFMDKSGFAYQKWLEARRRLLAPYLPRRKGEGVDPDYWVWLVGRAAPGWEAAVMRKRVRLSEREIEADDLSDEEVAEYKEI
jgi:hypothetical protein